MAPDVYDDTHVTLHIIVMLLLLPLAEQPIKCETIEKPVLRLFIALMAMRVMRMMILLFSSKSELL